MSISRAISDAHGPLEEAMLASPPENAHRGLRGLLDRLLQGARQLHFSSAMLEELAGLDTQERKELTALLGTDENVRDHLSASIAIEALNRAEQGGVRVPALLNAVPWSIPPALSKRFLQDAVNAYLLRLDRPCIAMCRGAVETLVESLWSDDLDEIPNLGKAIRQLRDADVVSAANARDMWFINGQAKEVLHDEPAPEPLDAAECLKRLGSLLVELYPEGGRGAV